MFLLRRVLVVFGVCLSVSAFGREFKFRNYVFPAGVPTGNIQAMRYAVNCFEKPNVHDCWYDNYIAPTRYSQWSPDSRRAVRRFIESGSCMLPVTVGGSRHATICPADALTRTSHVAAMLFGNGYKDYCMTNCGKQLKKAAATTGWISEVARQYHHYLMNELSSKLMSSVVMLKYGVTPEFKEEANAVMDGLRACMKEELSFPEPSEDGIRNCYNTFRRAMEELMQ